MKETKDGCLPVSRKHYSYAVNKQDDVSRKSDRGTPVTRVGRGSLWLSYRITGGPLGHRRKAISAEGRVTPLHLASWEEK